MHHYFAAVCSRISWFSTKCSEKITVYQSIQNVYQLLNILWIHVMSDVTMHVNMTRLTVEDRLLINTEKAGFLKK